jgi:hypothetical protein
MIVMNHDRLPDRQCDADSVPNRPGRLPRKPIANTKRLVNTSLPLDVELGAGWDACIASLARPAAQDGIKALMSRGFHKPGDAENRLGYYVGQIPRQADSGRGSQLRGERAPHINLVNAAKLGLSLPWPH